MATAKNSAKIEECHEPDLLELGQQSPPLIFPSFHLWGHTFSPKRITEETGFVFAEANEPNEVNVAGPFRGRPLKYGPGYGSAIIRPPEHVPCGERLVWMAEKILAGHTRKFRKEYGIVHEVMYLTAHYQYKQECSLVLPAWISQSLHDIPLVVTCVRNDEPPDSFAM
jgi:hypothetical protein